MRQAHDKQKRDYGESDIFKRKMTVIRRKGRDSKGLDQNAKHYLHQKEKYTIRRKGTILGGKRNVQK